jgi:hypothetical protein
MGAPTVKPDERGQVAPACGYRPGDRVWVHRHGGWHPGVVDRVSAMAVLVTYRVVDERGHLVDTVTADYVITRAEPDPDLDAGWRA